MALAKSQGSGGQKVIFVAPVAMAKEIRVILVEADGGAERFGKVLRAGHQDAFPGPVVEDQVREGGAFGCAIFRMGVIVVKAGAIAQD
jgi:hypothetical protein